MYYKKKIKRNLEKSLIESGDLNINLTVELTLCEIKALKNALIEYLDGEENMISYNGIIRKLSELINKN
jgi:hypothetical protein